MGFFMPIGYPYPMQYNININQKAVVEHFPKMDLKDASLIDFLDKFSRSEFARKHLVFEEGMIWFWASYSILIKEMPLLQINDERSMKGRIDKLIRLGILLRHPDCSLFGKSYFAFTAKKDVLFYDTPTLSNVGGGTLANVGGGTLANVPYHSTYNHTTDNQEENTSTSVELFFSEAVEVLEFLNEKTKRGFGTRGPDGKVNRKKVAGLLKAGATVEELKNVILLKGYEWNFNPEMFAYLRPETLFRPANFKKYCDEVDMLRNDKQKAKAWRSNIDKKRARMNGSARPTAVATPEGVAEAIRILAEDY